MFGKSPIIILMLVFGLFLFGCNGQQAAPQAQPASPEGSTPSEQPTEQPTQPATEQPTEEPTIEPEEEPPAGLDIGMMTCFALMGSGTPVECTMSSSYQGETSTIKFYMKGEEKMRYEFSNSMGSECRKMVMIQKDKMMYMGCEGQKYMGTSCDWYAMSTEPEPVEPGGPAEPSAEGYVDYASEIEEMPTTECSCVAWTYDESKFDTPGKVCDEDEFMEELMGGFNYS